MAGNAGWFAGAICKYANVKMWKCFVRAPSPKPALPVRRAMAQAPEVIPPVHSFGGRRT